MGIIEVLTVKLEGGVQNLTGLIQIKWRSVFHCCYSFSLYLSNFFHPFPSYPRCYLRRSFPNLDKNESTRSRWSKAAKIKFNTEYKMMTIDTYVLGKGERECSISQRKKILERYQTTGSFSTPPPTGGYIGEDVLTSILITAIPPLENYYQSQRLVELGEASKSIWRVTNAHLISQSRRFCLKWICEWTT